MSKRTVHALTWSQKSQTYELSADGLVQQRLTKDDEAMWQGWLEGQTRFSFRSEQGHLTVLKEGRSRGTGYWYAYSYMDTRKKKHYLGLTSAVTLARLLETVSLLFATSRTTPSLFAAPTPFPPVLLLPKLAPPGLPATLVERTSILCELDGASERQLTFLTAPAGFGKTTLLAAWANRRRQVVAWLSLDEQDNDPARFWSYVIAALRQGWARTGKEQLLLGETALSMLYSPQVPAFTTIVTTLINDITTSNQEIILVLDDYHVLNDPAIITSFQFLFDYFPPCFHVILAGRSEPLWALARLRARGQVLQLGDQHLRFSRTEIKQFLQRSLQEPLQEAEIDVLEQRSEGWIAGLQLAVLAMHTRHDRRSFVQHLDGGQRFIVEYLQEEVLSHQTPAVQEFLLYTSILTRLHSSLCYAVTQMESEQACQDMLLMLEKANLFLAPLDEERQWFRVHTLFRNVLQTRLQTLYPEQVALLHQRAGYWYAQQRDIHPAIVHALAGGDYPFAATLLAQSAELMWLNGKGKQLHAWIMSLPDDVLRNSVPVALTAALHLVFQAYSTPEEEWQRVEAQTKQSIERIATIVQVATPHTGTVNVPMTQNRLRLLHMWMVARTLIVRQKHEELYSLGLQMQEAAKADTITWKLLPAHTLSSSMTNLASQIPTLMALKQQAEEEEQYYEAAWVMYLLCVVYQRQGELDEASLFAQGALHHLRQVGKAHAIFGYAHLALAEVQQVKQQHREALEHVDLVLQFARPWHHLDLQIQAYCHMVSILLAQEKEQEAQQAFDEVKGLDQQSMWPQHQQLIRTVQVELWLYRGDLQAIARWVATCEINLQCTSSTAYKVYTTLVQAYVALQRQSEAQQLLTHLLEEAQRSGNMWDLIKIKRVQTLLNQISPLTMREQEVLQLLAQGKTNQDIADALVVSLATAKKHVANILAKLGVENRVQAIVFAREHALL